MSIYTQIDANKRKSWLIMVLFVAFVAGGSYVFGQAMGYGGSYVGLALVISGFAAIARYYFFDSIVLGISGARQVTEKEENLLFDVITNIAISASIPRPKVYIINDPSPNAFATGRDPKHAAVC